jgi:hypothetical protein
MGVHGLWSYVQQHGVEVDSLKHAASRYGAGKAPKVRRKREKKRNCKKKKK